VYLQNYQFSRGFAEASLVLFIIVLAVAIADHYRHERVPGTGIRLFGIRINLPGEHSEVRRIKIGGLLAVLLAAAGIALNRMSYYDNEFVIARFSQFD
jgi:hypothetical protein